MAPNNFWSVEPSRGAAIATGMAAASHKRPAPDDDDRIGVFTGTNRKQVHNDINRRRTARINTLIDALADRVPGPGRDLHPGAVQPQMGMQQSPRAAVEQSPWAGVAQSPREGVEESPREGQEPPPRAEAPSSEAPHDDAKDDDRSATESDHGEAKDDGEPASPRPPPRQTTVAGAQQETRSSWIPPAGGVGSMHYDRPKNPGVAKDERSKAAILQGVHAAAPLPRPRAPHCALPPHSLIRTHPGGRRAVLPRHGAELRPRQQHRPARGAVRRPPGQQR